MLSQRTGYARQPPYLWEEQWEGGPAGGQRYEKGAAGGGAGGYYEEEEAKMLEQI